MAKKIKVWLVNDRPCIGRYLIQLLQQKYEIEISKEPDLFFFNDHDDERLRSLVGAMR